MKIYLTTRDDSPYFEHYRTKGSKNGERRYQYEDGSYTPLGRIHYGIGDPNKPRVAVEGSSSRQPSGSQTGSGGQASSASPASKAGITKRSSSSSDDRFGDAVSMSDNELQAVVLRLQREKQYSQLVKEMRERDENPILRSAKSILGRVATELAAETIKDAARYVVKSAASKGAQAVKTGSDRVRAARANAHVKERRPHGQKTNPGHYYTVQGSVV